MVAHRHDINLHIWFIDVALDLLKRYSDCVCFLRKSFIGTIYLLLEFIRYLYSYAFFDRGRALFGDLAAKNGERGHSVYQRDQSKQATKPKTQKSLVVAEAIGEGGILVGVRLEDLDRGRVVRSSAPVPVAPSSSVCKHIEKNAFLNRKAPPLLLRRRGALFFFDLWALFGKHAAEDDFEDEEQNPRADHRDFYYKRGRRPKQSITKYVATRSEGLRERLGTR